MVRILAMERVRGCRIKLVLEDGSSFCLLKSALQARPMQPGDEVDPEEFRNWVMLQQYRPALEKAVSMLAGRACSQKEIHQKLRQIGYSEETIEMVLTKLNINHLLNDQEFADQWVSQRAGKKYGPRRIEQELRQKGVSSKEIEESMASVSEDDYLAHAVRLAEKAWRNAKPGEDPRKTRSRILSALVRKGYDWELARRALDRVTEE